MHRTPDYMRTNLAARQSSTVRAPTLEPEALKRTEEIKAAPMQSELKYLERKWTEKG